MDSLVKLSVCFTYFILLFCSLILFQIAGAIPSEPHPTTLDINEYHPEIKYVGRNPLYTFNHLPSPPNSAVPVFVKVLDKYGTIQQVILSYWTGSYPDTFEDRSLFFAKREHPPRNNITMKLINGIPSNGTYSASIPKQKDNTLVHYQIYLKDDLNYTLSNYPGEDYWVANHKIVRVNIAPLVKSQKPVNFTTELIDYDSKIKNVTLSYAVIAAPLNCREELTASEFSTVKMELSSTFDYYRPDYNTELDYAARVPKPATYEASIPAVPINGTICYFVNSTDYEGYNDSTQIITMPVMKLSYETDNLNFHGEPLVIIRTIVSNINLDSETANIGINLEGGDIKLTDIDSNIRSTLVNSRDGSENLAFKMVEGNLNEREDTKFPVRVINLDNTRFKEGLDLIMTGSERNGFLRFHTASNAGIDSFHFLMTGNPAAFPFDHYYVNLILTFPFKDVIFENHAAFDKMIYSSWVPRPSARTLNTENIERLYSYLDCRIDNGSFRCGLRNTVLPSEPILIAEDMNHTTYLNIHTDFTRNFSLILSTVILPIVAIFLLIGTIFILEPNKQFMILRVTMTIGIFAFLLTFPPIINDMKAPSITNVTTVADFLITLSLTATIGATMSSVIGNLLVRRGHKHVILPDLIVILVISLLIVLYFMFDNSLDTDIRIWLAMITIGALGYGLLLRVFGKRISQKLTEGTGQRVHVSK